MERQLLAGMSKADAAAVVARLCGVQAQVPSSAELVIRVRSAAPAGTVDELVATGGLLRTWAMRGTLHLLTPDDGAAFLSLIAAARPWEKKAWANWFGLTPAVIGRMADVAHDALADGPLSRDDLVRVLSSQPGLEHVETPLRESWGTAFKPLAWQGLLAFGPIRDGRPTFVRPDRVSEAWSGLPDADDAAPRAIVAYLRAYGPATPDRFHRWMGRLSKRQVTAWWRSAGDLLARVDVDGEEAYVAAEDVDALLAAQPSDALRLLPGFDQWVLGPGTDDGHVIPPGRRAAVSRQSGWISPIVVRGGVVAGTWRIDRDTVAVRWFTEAGTIPRREMKREVARVGSLVDTELGVVISRG